MKYQKGASLIEILVTLTIVSFGLLGIAGIILNSMKSNQSSYARTQASFLANDIIARMRANRATAENSDLPYNISMTDAAPSADTVAASDLNQWRTTLANTLPSGTGSVNVNAATRTATVVVQWNNARVAGGSETQNTRISTRL